MGAAIEDVHHGHRQNVGMAAADVPIQAHPHRRSRRFRRRERNRQNGVGAQTALVVGAVQLDEPAVDSRLIQRIHSHQCRRNHAVDVINRFSDALAQISRIAVPQFARLVHPR